MRSCAEAWHQFTVCGDSDRDRNSDGIPCENICGDTHEMLRARLAEEGVSVAEDGAAIVRKQSSYSCSPRKTCRQMVSCDEARFHLETCGNRGLDRDGDGRPCNALCR